MSYTKSTWVPHVTLVSSAKLNNIENGLEKLDLDLFDIINNEISTDILTTTSKTIKGAINEINAKPSVATNNSIEDSQLSSLGIKKTVADHEILIDLNTSTLATNMQINIKKFGAICDGVNRQITIENFDLNNKIVTTVVDTGVYALDNGLTFYLPFNTRDKVNLVKTDFSIISIATGLRCLWK